MPDTPITPRSSDYKPLPRHKIMLIIYVAIFGVIWGIGTSVLAGALPPEPITRSLVIGGFEAAMVLLIKIAIRHPLSVTFAMIIATTIAIFTFSFGPPNPYKPILVIAGFAFDAGTLFRTAKLRLWNLLVGLVCYIVVLCLGFLAILYILEPAVVSDVAKALPVAAGIFLLFGFCLAIIFYRVLLKSPPSRVREIWRQLGRD